ncbi:MAG: hypothetical protein WCV84_05465 [Patescibacteria group bacterium]
MPHVVVFRGIQEPRGIRKVLQRALKKHHFPEGVYSFYTEEKIPARGPTPEIQLGSDNARDQFVTLKVRPNGTGNGGRWSVSFYPPKGHDIHIFRRRWHGILTSRVKRENVAA